MNYYIGIDLGGTNVRVAKVSEKGDIIQMIKESTEIDQGVDHVMNKIIHMIEGIDDYQRVKGIGMGVPGPVETKTGTMLLASNLAGFEGYCIKDPIEKYFNIPTFVDNDANVAGLGEATQGAGIGCETCYYVTISTGIGGALIHNGQVISGKHGHAGEIGNLIIDRNREKLANQLNKGAVENEASGTALIHNGQVISGKHGHAGEIGNLIIDRNREKLANQLNKGAVENEASGTAITRKGKVLFGDSIEHAGHVFNLARQGNPQALELVDNMAYDLAVMFSLIGHVVDPDMFIIGGGVMTKARDVFFDKMVAYYKTLVHKKMVDVQFCEAVLEEPGIIGAAMLPLSHI